MNQERVFQLIRMPIVTEKSNRLADANNQHTFKVLQDATKGEIKQAVQQLYQVEVKKVTTSNVVGKTKRFKQMKGKRDNWKKAIVTLKEGHQINIIESA